MAGAGGDTSLENVIFEDDAAIKQARSEVPYNDAVGVWHTYRVEAKNNSIKLFIDGTFMFQESVQQNPFLDPGQNGVAGLGYDNDSYNFGPFVPLMHLLLSEVTIPLQRVSSGERPSFCASCLVSSSALPKSLVQETFPGAFLSG